MVFALAPLTRKIIPREELVHGTCSGLGTVARNVAFFTLVS
jgi:hypothetical protein